MGEVSYLKGAVIKIVFKLNAINTGKRVIYIVDNNHTEAFAEIKKEIQNKYGIKMPNRDLIIKSLISFLVHGDYKEFKVPRINLSVIRSDIKDFYPSINKHKLYQKINSSNMLSHESMIILKKILFNKKYTGVPLGLSFSNHLAELFLEKFDKQVDIIIEPVIYFRYIDDFICINYCDFMESNERKIYTENYKRELSKLLRESDLTLNRKKTKSSFYMYNPKMKNKNQELDFEFLGYHFKTENEKLKISISDEKLTKYINRLSGYFYTYKKGKRREVDFWRLYYKVLNELYGIKVINKDNLIMKSGFAYNYRYINDYNKINKFINHFQKVIYSLKLNPNKLYLLLNLFHGRNGKIFMEKRYNYLRLTNNQKDIIRNRLKIQYLGYDTKIFIKKMFISLYNQ